MPTRGGLGKIQENINLYNEQITNLINDAARSGKTLDVNDLYRGLGAIKYEMQLVTDQPLVVEAAFKRIKKEWKASLDISKTKTPQQVQALKQNIYKDLSSLYEQTKKSPAKVSLRKEIAKNAKEMLEDLVPEIKTLNFEEGSLIALYDAIEGRANAISNQDFFNFGLAMKMGTGGGVGSMLAGQTGAAVGSTGGIGLAVFGHVSH